MQRRGNLPSSFAVKFEINDFNGVDIYFMVEMGSGWGGDLHVKLICTRPLPEFVNGPLLPVHAVVISNIAQYLFFFFTPAVGYIASQAAWR